MSGLSIPPQRGIPMANAPFVEQSMHQPNITNRQPANAPSSQASQAAMLRRRGFLSGLATLMSRRGTPLPPALTGVASDFDPNNTPWNGIEPSPTFVGAFRLGGRDIDLFKLWWQVVQSGGGAKMNSEHKWNLLLPFFELPDQLPGGGSTAANLGNYYMALLHPYEDVYRQTLQTQHLKALAATGRYPPAPPRPAPVGAPQPGFPPQPPPPGLLRPGSTPDIMGMMNVPNPNAPATNQALNNSAYPYPGVSSRMPPQQLPPPADPAHSLHDPPLSSVTPLAIDFPPGIGGLHTDLNAVDHDAQLLKRKLSEEDEDDSRRSRQRIGGTPGTLADLNTGSALTPTTAGLPSSTPVPSATANAKHKGPPSRRKIEYVPLAREADTYGGRAIQAIEEEIARITHHRPLRDINEWGVVDVDGLTLSIRSRLSGELSYALTTFTLVSTMRGQTHGSGFPIAQCPDLLDEVLDLVEDEAFGQEDSTNPSVDSNARISTHREMIVTAQDKGNQLFFMDHVPPATYTGPRQRPGNTILVVLNIVRNLATTHDNVVYLAKHERLLDLLLRLCGVTKGEDGQLRPVSAVLSLQDLITLRKDVLFALASLAPAIQFPENPTESTERVSRRVFELVSSYIIDPVEAVPPSGCAQVSGLAMNSQLVPPTFPDVALELFTRLSQPDNNRRVLSQTIPQPWIWELLKALVHRLPVVDADFHLAARDTWLSYLEKVILSMYSLCFLAPPSLRSRIKEDTSLGFTKTIIRMVYKFLTNPNPDVRSCLIVCSRRAIETMRVVDGNEDAFDTPKVTSPAALFGMGSREVGEEGIEKGTGLLGGHRQLTWDLLMLREIISDPIMFSELECMARVDKVD